MKKLFLLGAMVLSALTSWAQTSPYAGNAVANGNEWYLYNVETGYWLGNNNHKWGDWTTRAQANEVGLDWKIEAIDGGWRLDPKYGRNNSMNSSNFYLDTDAEVTAWTFDEVACDGATKAYKIHAGDKYLGVVLGTNDKQDLGYQLDFDGNTQGTWVLVSREERLALASEENPVEASFLIPCYDMGDNNPRYAWNLTSNGSKDGPKVMWEHNRVWETWGVTEMDAYTTCSNIPNGKYLVYSIGAYVPTGGGGMNADDYNDYLNRGSEAVHALAYANNATAKMASIYSQTYSEHGADRWPKEIVPGVWVADGWGHVANQCGHYNKYWSEPAEVVVADGTLRLGVKMDGEAPNSSWVIFSGMRMKYLGEVEDLLTPALEALNANITAAEAYNGMTTDVLQTALNNALAAAKALTNSTDVDAISSAAGALINALNAAKDVNVSTLRPTVALAKAEGIDVADQENYLANGTTNEVDNRLRLVRNLRKLNAIEKVDITKIECSETTAEEGDYYLYNVGAGIFFSTTSDWGTHIAIDNPGMLIHFRPDGEWDGAPGRPVYHLSGNGWDGMNWSEEYWDKNGENKLAFVPVEGKDKVYNMCEWDNYNWHFVYDPAEDVCDGNTHYWNAVQKRDWNRNDYKDNPYAQWMLVSPEAYKAAMDKATEDSKLDVTFMIENPNFTKAKVDGNDNWTRGWTGVGGDMRGDGREPWMVIEWFERSADMKQTIKGLPAGKYEVSCYGFYRDGNSDHEAGLVNNGETPRQLAKVVAINGDEVKAEGLLPNVTSEAGMMPGVGETRPGVAEFACWPWQANQYFQTGLYKATTEAIEVGEDGELTIGVEYNHTSGNDGSWVVVGNFRLTCVETYVPVEVSDAKWATFVAPTGVDFSSNDNVDAYAVASIENGYITLAPAKGVPADNVVVVEATAAGTHYVQKCNPAEIPANELQASATDVTADGTQYVLAKVDDEVGFHKVKVGDTIAAGKGYLVIAAAAKAFFPFGGEATDIEGVIVEKLDGTYEVYNLQGQKLQNAQKGINIINGKKVVIK